jgi:hypothetical protein
MAYRHLHHLDHSRFHQASQQSTFLWLLAEVVVVVLAIQHVEAAVEVALEACVM